LRRLASTTREILIHVNFRWRHTDISTLSEPVSTSFAFVLPPLFDVFVMKTFIYLRSTQDIRNSSVKN